jgi:hypothetical protein
MAFFRTKDTRRDPQVRADAHKQRRQQLQAQQQMLEDHKSALAAEPQTPA